MKNLSERTITVDKKQLLEKIKENKVKHIEDYVKAVEAYKVEAKRQLKANLYETDIEELDSHSPKVRHITDKDKKKATKIAKDPKYKTREELLDTRNDIFGKVISDRVVPCKCNKCGNQVNGDLISCIYSPGADIMTPFISYFCSKCQHSGHRSVKEKALPTKDFEKYYF